MNKRSIYNTIDKEEMINNLIASSRIEGIHLSKEKAEAIYVKVMSLRQKVSK